MKESNKVIIESLVDTINRRDGEIDLLKTENDKLLRDVETLIKEQMEMAKNNHIESDKKCNEIKELEANINESKERYDELLETFEQEKEENKVLCDENAKLRDMLIKMQDKISELEVALSPNVTSKEKKVPIRPKKKIDKENEA